MFEPNECCGDPTRFSQAQSDQLNTRSTVILDAMASTGLSANEDMQALLQDGFVYVQDPVSGHRVDEMERNAIPFASHRGFEFFKVNVLDQPRIRDVLDSSFEWYGLGLYRSFGAVPGDYSFRQSDPGSDIESLLIQFWKEGSKITFWRESHKKHLPTTKGENNLWRVPRIALQNRGLVPVEVTFERGGYSIRDTRVIVAVSEGSAITFEMATREVMKKWWTPMKLPKSLQKMVQSMEAPNFGMNVTYLEDEET
ncbi:hypothetical protein FPRO05_14087 [Fusarium proliferatum]|uniref:Uncharacterized protein n=1 Tax=Gibberella intermedia TaxID=948311 RepID=A0A365MW88_GIBIN|nr:hypothetical protein FPRO05_14087 [Fusarium proliferatum]